MKIKVQDLTKLQLNWAVATSEEHPKAIDTSGLDGPVVICGFKQKMLHSNREGQEWIAYQPSSNWTQGGPIVEREITRMFKNLADGWTAQIRHEKEHPSLVGRKVTTGWTNASGPTPLIAAMRCFVENRLGSEVEIPDILCNSYI